MFCIVNKQKSNNFSYLKKPDLICKTESFNYNFTFYIYSECFLTVLYIMTIFIKSGLFGALVKPFDLHELVFLSLCRDSVNFEVNSTNDFMIFKHLLVIY